MEFFQSTYFLIGAIAVVVLLVILLLLMRRRSSRTGSPQPKKAAAQPQTQSTAPPWPGDKDLQVSAQSTGQTTPADIAEATRATDTDLASVLSRPAPGEPDFSTPPASAAQEETPPAAAPQVASSTKPVFRSTPAGDPERAAVPTIASGRGPLESAETRRLELYRPDRILQVTETLKAEELASKAPNHLVLDRLRAVSDYASFVMVQVAATATRTEPVPAEPEQPSSTAEPEETPVSPQPGLEPEPGILTPHESPLEEIPPEPAPAMAEIVQTGEVQTEPLLPFDTSAPTEPVASEPVASEPVATEPVATEFVPAEIEPAVPEAIEELEVPEEIEAIEIIESPRPAESAVDPVEPPAETHEDTAFLAPLTAEGLADIPKEQWGDAFSRLSASETCRLFETSENQDLKMQLVDHIERRGGADALLILDTCLRDPDPEVQVHALNAAERLLKEKS